MTENSQKPEADKSSLENLQMNAKPNMPIKARPMAPPPQKADRG